MSELYVCLKKFYAHFITLTLNKALLKPTKPIHYWTTQLIRSMKTSALCL